MSKHLGNVLDPIELMEQHGADAVRWFMLAAGSPWTDRRVGHEAIEEIVRKVLLTYCNTASFSPCTPTPRAGGRARSRCRHRPSGPCWTGGPSPSCTGSPRTWTPRWRTSTP